MDAAIVEVLVEPSDDLFLRGTYLKLGGIDAVLPDLAAGSAGVPFVDVGAAPGEACIQTGLEVIHSHLGGREPKFVIRAASLL
jgi:hypothetical protein